LEIWSLMGMRCKARSAPCREQHKRFVTPQLAQVIESDIRVDLERALTWSPYVRR